MRFGWRNVQFLHDAPHRFADPQDVVVSYLALDWRGVVRMHPKRRRRAGIRHGVLSLGKQLIDVLKRRAYVALMILAKTMCFCLVTHFSYRRCLPRPPRLTPACACDRDGPTRASPRLMAGKTFARSASV